MSTKTFNIGDYGYHGKIKVSSSKQRVKVEFFDKKGHLDNVRFYGYNSINHLELDICQEADSYYVDKIVSWVMALTEYKASFNSNLDLLTCYSFNCR